MQKLFEPQTLGFSRPAGPLSENVPKVGLAEGHSKRKVKTMDFSRFFAVKELDTKLPQEKKNAGPAREKKQKAETVMRTLHGQRYGHKENKYVKGNTFLFRASSGEDLALPPPCSLDDTVPNTLSTGYYSLPKFVVNVKKRWQANIHKALHVCPDVTFNRYHAVSLLLQAASLPSGQLSYLFLNKEDLISLRLMVWLFVGVTTENELGE